MPAGVLWKFRTSKTLAKKLGLRGTVDTFGASGAVRQHRLIRTCQWFGFAGIASFRRYWNRTPIGQKPKEIGFDSGTSPGWDGGVTL